MTAQLKKFEKNAKIFSAIYDGDTSKAERLSIRNDVSVLLTNPDMLHLSLLPHHTMWKRFFSHLRYIVIDEVHVYRGVFGSHFANLIQRLERVVRFYNGTPIYICTSATVSDPKDFAEKLIGQPFVAVDQDRSGHSAKDLLFYNPPFVDKTLGIRRGILEEGLKITQIAQFNDTQTLLFVRSRRSVEIMVKKGRETLGEHIIRGYRSGYLASERREIEKGLRNGDIRSVVATNALELGIDIGGIDCVILLGYPGTIASFLQQIGRAGRKTKRSMAIFIPSMDPLDQFILQNPQYILGNTPEQPLINPQNMLILFNQLRCAAYELPFIIGDKFGNLSPSQLQNYLDVLCMKGDLINKDGTYYWIGETYPSGDISIRSISASPFDLLEKIEGKTRKIGEVDSESALWMVHPGAIYLHEGESYLVEDLLLDEHKAILRKGEFPYYTNPKQEQEITIREILDEKKNEKIAFTFGNVMVSSQVIGYEKIDWNTNEVLKTESLALPSSELETQAFCIVLGDKTTEILRQKELWLSDPIDYGKHWTQIRQQVLSRDGHRCSLCGKQEDGSLKLHVHHKKPFRTFSDPEIANNMENLLTLCERCHQRVEQTIRIRSGLSGLGYIFSHLSPLYLMCDTRDIGLFIEPRWKPVGDAPVIMLYDNFPGGIGLAETIFHKYQLILENARMIIEKCGCAAGCPSCVGPVNQEFIDPKIATLALLNEII